MSGKRLRIDQWLRRQLQLGNLHGLEWIGHPEGGLFAVNWSHKSAHTWDLADRQNNIFLAYCLYRDGHHQQRRTVTAKDYKQLKQNFRCALRGSRHIRHESKLSRSRGSEARRVYRFVAAAADDAVAAEDGASSSDGDSTSTSSPRNLPGLPELNVDTDLVDLDYLMGAASSHTSSSGAASGTDDLPAVDVDADLFLFDQIDGPDLLEELFQGASCVFPAEPSAADML